MREDVMSTSKVGIHRRRNVWITVICVWLIAPLAGVFLINASLTAQNGSPSAKPPAPYAKMPAIPPIGVRADKYADVPDDARGPMMDPAKGYRIQELGDGLYLIADGSYQSTFMVYEGGVVLVDAPPAYASKIREAVREITDKPITHLVYSHAHKDHIGGAKVVGGSPIIIAHAETNRLLQRENDPDRPLATVTFDTAHKLSVGTQVLELSYHGNAHQPGNIFIHAPRQRVLMAVDLVFPGWMPWRRFAVAQDVRGYFDQVRMISAWDFDTFVGGHVARTGTRKDVATQLAFMTDLRAAAQIGLQRTIPGEGLNSRDRGNAWAFYDHYIDRVVVDCVNQLTPKWSSRLAGFDVYIWDQCYSMEQSLRID
jgi:glyoxylase-like metal-dependent hydrolase (beta-lactamase superfamily II)